MGEGSNEKIELRRRDGIASECWAKSRDTLADFLLIDIQPPFLPNKIAYIRAGRLEWQPAPRNTIFTIWR